MSPLAVVAGVDLAPSIALDMHLVQSHFTQLSVLYGGPYSISWFLSILLVLAEMNITELRLSFPGCIAAAVMDWRRLHPPGQSP